ncbi:MAG: zf-HC2 domain-containing protein [Gemmatimonadaceae bacterium]|nr:zf-HC2 domain-containing protein [Gemmatimonadaceae bacterium]
MREPIRDIDCLTAVRHLWDYLDQELDEPRMLEIEHHLEICQDCLRHAEFDRRFLDALSRMRERSELPSAIRSQVLAALEAAGYSPGP